MTVVLAAGAIPEFMPPVAAILVATAVIAWICQRLRLVPIVGYLLAGVLVGPNVLGLVERQETVEAAAEIGVILLLFTIGIEFSLERLNRVRRLVLGGGAATVLLATAATVALLLPFGVSLPVAVYTGLLVSVSSTAVVLSILSARGETTTESGQLSIAVLIFEDLAVVAMVLLVPMLALDGGSATGIAQALLVAAAVIAIVLAVATRLMPPLLEAVARVCSPPVFLLSVIAICFGTAYLTSLVGVSVSLGAFLAGLMISESRFAFQALGEVLPLEIVFTATFFVSVGMLLNPAFVVANLGLVALAVGAVLVIKTVTGTLAARLVGVALPVAAGSALLRAQIGEFSFVLELVGREAGFTPAGLGDQGVQTFLASSVLLMMVTPALAPLGARLSGHLARQRPPVASEAGPPDPPAAPADLADHVIVAGYGQAARMIAAVLAATRIPHVITTLSPEGALEAEANGHTVIRGDAARRHTLVEAGMPRAQVLVVADDDPAMAERVAQVARNLNPHVSIVVRTRYNVDAEPLANAGADHVVTEEHASAAAVTERVLRGYRLAEEDIREQVLRLWHAHRHPDRPRRVPRADEAERARRLSAFGTVIDTERRMTLRVADSSCSHLDTLRPVLPSAPGCEECLEADERWVHLRVCMFCGHVGCCDSSPNRHATKHHERTGHPIVASGEPGEDWGWCYPDALLLEPR